MSRYRQCLDERELFVGTAAVERELFVVLLRLRELFVGTAAVPIH